MQWNNPGNKTVSVNYTDNHGCTATSSQTKTVTVKSQPVAILDGTNGVVATQRVTYTAGPGSNYTWTVSGNYELVDGSALTDKTVNVKWNTAGNVSVSVSYYAENGCLTNTKTLNIVVSPPGTPDISGETSVCDNTNHDYSTQTDRYNYKWSVTGGTIQGADNQPGVTVKWGSAGKGILKVKYSEASTSDQIESTGTEVTINSVPSISNISTPAGVCDGMALVLSEPTITNIPPQVSSEGWKLNEVAFISGDEVNHAQHHGKSLYYEATNFCGSNKSNVVIITVHELPEVKLTANDNVCFDTEITFTTDAGQKSYEWKYAHDVDATLVAGGGTSDNTATLRWNSSGNKTISVNYTDNHGCTATSPQSKVVTVKSKAVATLSGAAAVVVTQETTYTAGMGSNYNWDFGDGATIVSGAATATPLVKWTTTGKKTVSVNYLIDGCPTNVKTLEVEVSGQGTPVIGGAASVCFDQTQEYSTEQGNYKYEWFIEGGDFVGGIKNEYKVTVKWGSAGEGSLIVKYSKSPASEQVESNKKEITINGLPSIGAISTPPSGVCFGAILTLSDPEVTSSFTIDSKGWKLGGSPFTSGSTVSYTPDNYSLVYEATDVCGTAEKAVTGGITVHELPTVTIVPIPSACPGTPIDLETAVGNPDGHTLLFYTQLTGGTPLSDPEVSPSVESNYYVAAVNATTSCVSAERKLITVTIGAVATITKQPVSPGVVGIGGSFELSVEATGSNLHYQWYKGVDELPGAGAKLATYSVSSAVESDYGEYYVIVSGDCNSSQESNKVTVHILNPDATLKDLQVNGITVPDFDPQTTEYTCVLPCDVVLADITGIPNDNDAKVDNKTNQTLEPGDNEYAIKVTAANGFTTKIYKVNINRECYVPKIVKDLEDTIVCVNSSHTFEIEVEGKGLTYEWYYGNRRILGANTNRYTISRVQLSDYEKYYVIVRSNYNGYRASTYSRQARLWVADQLPETLRFATYPDPATTGKTYHIRLAGYSDVTEYKWSYRIGTTLAVDQNAVAQNSNDDVTFSPEIGAVGENETWATFGTLSEGTGTLTATLTHPCGTRVATQTIRVTYPTGTENVTADRITIYPNPTAGVIRISNTVSNQEVKITDVTGSLKGSYRTQEGTTTIDLTGYLKGAYMIQYAGKTYKVIRK
jgi:hypothetical protein